MARRFHAAAPVAAPARLQGGRASQGPPLRQEEGPRGRTRLPDEGEEAREGPLSVPAGGRCRLAPDVHHAPAPEPHRPPPGGEGDPHRVALDDARQGLRRPAQSEQLEQPDHELRERWTARRHPPRRDRVSHDQQRLRRILHFLEYVNEQIALHRAALILSVDERAFDAKELAYIERDTVALE